MVDNDNKKVRVLVVDDSSFMRRLITDILKSDSEIEVIDSARDGKEALEKVKLLQPDVVTLDVEMPIMDGIDCLKQIMMYKKLPVLMLSSHTKEGADATMKALEYGAIDFITKPTNIFNISGDEKKNEIIEKVKIAKHTIVQIKQTKIIENIQNIKKQTTQKLKYVVAIGTSTGGPRALQHVIPNLPYDIPAAFLVVQHMPAGFTKSLAERLNNISNLTVKEAENNDIIKAGYVYIAPGDYHMLIEKSAKPDEFIIKLNQQPSVGGHRPSVNVMMDSLSETEYKNVLGVIMTGMGGDGAEGLKKLKVKNNAYVIAQDEKSCVVFGMPKVAIQNGVVDIITPLNNIAKEIIKNLGGKDNGYEPIS